MILAGIWNKENVSTRLGVFKCCSRKGTFAFFVQCLQERVEDVDDEGSSKHSLTGQGELSTKPHWYLGCCLTPLLLSRLRAWDPRRKEGEIYEGGPVTSRKTHSSRQQFKVPKSQPCSKAPLLPLVQREPEKTKVKQAQIGQVWVLAASPLCFMSAVSLLALHSRGPGEIVCVHSKDSLLLAAPPVMTCPPISVHIPWGLLQLRGNCCRGDSQEAQGSNRGTCEKVRRWFRRSPQRLSGTCERHNENHGEQKWGAVGKNRIWV